MKRRRYLVTYDVSDDKRRTRIFKFLRNWGDHLQYSVFLCELDARERVIVERRLEEFVHHDEDQVLVVDLGPAEIDSGRIVAAVGKPYRPPAVVYVV